MIFPGAAPAWAQAPSLGAGDDDILTYARVLQEVLAADGVVISDAEAVTIATETRRQAVEALTIPGGAPTAGAEWAHLYETLPDLSPDVALGVTYWSLVDGPWGPILEGTAVIPDRGVGVVLRIGPGPGDNLNAYQMSVEVSAPGSFGQLRLAGQLALSSAFIIDNQIIADQAAAAGANALSFDFAMSDAIKELLPDRNAVTVTLNFDDRPEVNVSLALGDTGHALLQRAIAAWNAEPPWLDLTTAVAATAADESTADAYLYELTPDGTLLRHNATVAWRERGSDGPVYADIMALDGAFVVSFSLAPNQLDAVAANVTLDLFDASPGHEIGPTATFERIRVKAEATGNGTMLTGDRILNTPGYLVFALSPLHDADNWQLVDDGNWFEAELTLANGNPASLVFDIGDSGHAAFNEAMAAWAVTPGAN